jgi:chemotaxis protein MotB
MPPANRAGRGHGGNKGRRHNDVSHEEEGGSERWLVTYADMLTLLLVLFIVLFSISVVNTSKFISLKTSLAAVFGDGTSGTLTGGSGLLDKGEQDTKSKLSMSMAGQPMVPSKKMTTATSQNSVLPGGYTAQDVAKEVGNFRAIQQSIEKSLAAHGLKNAARFKITARGLVITIVTNSLVFPGNSASLLPEGQRILASVAPPLGKETRNIEVDGYTNQEKASTYPYPSGWELSSARASAVVRYLIGRGVHEQHLSAVGLNDLDPLYPPSDPRAAALNRRVEIVVRTDLPSTAGDDIAAAGK